MARLCERPGCSERGAVAYGFDPDRLLVWLAAFDPESERTRAGVLCKRHADSMVVPIGWTLDDRREQQPRLFKPRPPAAAAPVTPSRRRKKPNEGEQLQIDGTGEITRPPAAAAPNEPVQAWQPEFDHDDDLGGLLEVSSPLLARAFRGKDRRRD